MQQHCAENRNLENQQVTPLNSHAERLGYNFHFDIEAHSFWLI